MIIVGMIITLLGACLSAAMIGWNIHRGDKTWMILHTVTMLGNISVLLFLTRFV